MKQILIDVLPFEFKRTSLTESLKDGKLLVNGVLQRADAKNQNGRVYPEDILKREANKYMDNFVKQRRAMGELDHPESSVVNLKNVSHNIVDMGWEDKDLVGTVEILPTPSGNILRDLLQSGILLGISSRGLGSVKKDMREGTDVVQDDFDFFRSNGVVIEDVNEFNVFKTNQKAQFVKLKAANLGDVPPWHLGHPFDGKAWIFTDEIEIK